MPALDPPSLAAHTTDKELPPPPDFTPLTPLRHQPSTHTQYSSSRQFFSASPEPRTRSASGRGRIGWLLFFPTLVLMLLSAGLATFLLLWLTVIRGVSGPHGLAASIQAEHAFVVNEGTGADETQSRLLGLTISTITTQVVSMTAPFLVALSAYCIAGSWLSRQERPLTTTVSLPTPLQYGFLVKLLGASGIMSLYETGRYLARSMNRRVHAPPLLYSAFFLSAVIYFITYLISVTDLWLHATSFVVTKNSTIATNDPLNLGMAFNQTLCSSVEAPFPCLDEPDGWAFNEPWVALNGLLIASNTSTATSGGGAPSFSVVTLNDAADMAVIVPNGVNDAATFQAPSFGIQAECSSLTPQCLSSPISSVFNCTPAGFSQLPFIMNNTARTSGSRILAEINGTLVGGNETLFEVGVQYPSNPQVVLVQLMWDLNIAGFDPPNQFVTAVANDGILRAWAACNMLFFNVTLQYAMGQYAIVGAPERTSTFFAGTMWAPMMSQLINLQLVSNLQARVMTDPNDDSVISAVNQELSRLSLGVFAGTIMPTTSTNERMLQSGLLGRYPLAPVIFYVLLLYVYSLLALGICVWASCLTSSLIQLPDGRTVTALRLTQIHLTDPLTLVAASFPSRASQASNEHPVDMFTEDESTPRVGAGLDTSGDPTRPVFSVHKYQTSWIF